MTSIAGLLAEARKELQDSDSPALDAERLLCHVLGKPRSFLFTWPEQEVGELLAAQFHQLLVRRVSGEPVAHLLGRREFYGHEFLVSADTLIPRPDTELLVDVVWEKLPLWHDRPGRCWRWTILWLFSIWLNAMSVACALPM